MEGFRNLRKFIAPDGTFQKASSGVLLATTGIDAKGQIYPLGFAIVNTEDEANGTWYFAQLRLAYPSLDTSTVEADAAEGDYQPATCFVSDRHKGLINATRTVFPHAHHSFCCQHLWENLRKEYPNDKLRGPFWRAAYAVKQEAMESAFAVMEDIEPGISSWFVGKRHPQNWSTCLFDCKTYGHLTSNIIESFNRAILAERDLPIPAMLEGLRIPMSDWLM